MFRYSFNGKQISSEEYVERIVMDSNDYGETKTTALQIVKENRDFARKNGVNVWINLSGKELIIEYFKPKNRK